MSSKKKEEIKEKWGVYCSEPIKFGFGDSEPYDFNKEKENPRVFIFNKKIECLIHNLNGGYQVVFKSKKGELSAIFHRGSYGRQTGLWEIMPPKPPKQWGDSVLGYLAFEEVLKWVKKQL